METEDFMSRSVLPRATRLPTSYAGLIGAFPLRPLQDEVDYDNALEIAQALVGRTNLTEDQSDYLDVLADIIQKYEARQHSIQGGGGPLETLRRMLEERGMNASDLGRLLGNRALGGALLRGQRQLSKTHIRALADHFKVSTDLFFGD
jgi:HTH-type transcriptional regulator / antitoxin HigA